MNRHLKFILSISILWPLSQLPSFGANDTTPSTTTLRLPAYMHRFFADYPSYSLNPELSLMLLRFAQRHDQLMQLAQQVRADIDNDDLFRQFLNQRQDLTLRIPSLVDQLPEESALAMQALFNQPTDAAPSSDYIQNDLYVDMVLRNALAQRYFSHYFAPTVAAPGTDLTLDLQALTRDQAGVDYYYGVWVSHYLERKDFSTSRFEPHIQAEMDRAVFRHNLLLKQMAQRLAYWDDVDLVEEPDLAEGLKAFREFLHQTTPLTEVSLPNLTDQRLMYLDIATTVGLCFVSGGGTLVARLGVWGLKAARAGEELNQVRKVVQLTRAARLMQMTRTAGMAGRLGGMALEAGKIVRTVDMLRLPKITQGLLASDALVNYGKGNYSMAVVDGVGVLLGIKLPARLLAGSKFGATAGWLQHAVPQGLAYGNAVHGAYVETGIAHQIKELSYNTATLLGASETTANVASTIVAFIPPAITGRYALLHADKTGLIYRGLNWGLKVQRWPTSVQYVAGSLSTPGFVTGMSALTYYGALHAGDSSRPWDWSQFWSITATHANDTLIYASAFGPMMRGSSSQNVLGGTELVNSADDFEYTRKALVAGDYELAFTMLLANGCWDAQGVPLDFCLPPQVTTTSPALTTAQKVAALRSQPAPPASTPPATSASEPMVFVPIMMLASPDKTSQDNR